MSKPYKNIVFGLNIKELVIFFIAILLFSLNILIFLNNYTNIFNSKDWDIAKDKLSHFVMGSHSFSCLNYIKSGRLELSDFYGFNQIEFKKGEDNGLRFDKVSFDLNLSGEKSYLYFLFRKNDSGCYALRFSNSKERSNCLIRYSSFMECERKTDIKYPALGLNTWYKITIEFVSDSLRLYINRVFIADINITDEQLKNGRIGFRCGFNRVFLDNIAVTGRYDDTTDAPKDKRYHFYESFNSPLKKYILFLWSFCFSLFYHFCLLVIVYSICHAIFNLNSKEALLLFISILKFLLAVSFLSLILQFFFHIGEYNKLNLFYFGNIKLPSLRPEYSYSFIFIPIFLYKIRNLPEIKLATSNFLQLVLFLLFLIFSLYFLNKGSLFSEASFADNKPIKIDKVIKNNVVLKYPLRIDLPDPFNGYVLSVIFKLSNTADKFLFVTDGAKFIITSDKRTFSGFEPDGTPNDFSFNYTDPEKKYTLNNNKYYQLKIVKAGCCMSAYINGKLVDRKLLESNSSTPYLKSAIYLFPSGGAPFIKTLSITRQEKHFFSFCYPMFMIMLKRVIFLVFFIFCFVGLAYMKKRSILGGSPGILNYLQLLVLLLPFFVVYFIFKDLLFNDSLFYPTALISYVFILMLMAYKLMCKPLIVFLCIVIIVLFALLFLPRPHIIFDLKSTAFSGFTSNKRNIARPPQQLDAFLYNNSFDEVYMSEFADKDKILLFGSSQTWGAGSADKDLTISGYLESFLNSLSTKRKVKVINCGINGGNSLYLGNFFNNFLITLKPEIVIINLSNNDYFFWKYSTYDKVTKKIRRLSFRKGDESYKLIQDKFKAILIEKFIKPCKKNNIKMIFIEEPNSAENRLRVETVFKLHGVIAGLSSTYSIPVVSPQAVLDNYDIDSPLWWDFMHLSSLGQKILAQQIYSLILENNLLETMDLKSPMQK